MGTLTDPSAQPAATTPLLEVRDLHVRFETSRGTVHAVEGISYSVNRGEIVAVVGESGCGKSVSALAIMRLLAKTGRVPQGQILFEGQNLLDLSEEEMREKRGRDISMIFQEPMTSLNPVLSIGEQVMEPLKIHLKMNDEQATARALELLQLVGITDGPRRLEQYPHHLSGGMRQRVMIAIGLACNPKLIIADEPTTALDVTIQAQILELMKDLSRRLGIAMVVITHNLGIVARYADRVNVMYAARIIEQGTADHVFLEPAHPYSIGLMRSIPRLDLPRGIKLETIEGLPPDLRTPPAGCRFAPRCPYRLDACLVSAPLVPVAPDHASACIRAQGNSRRNAGGAVRARRSRDNGDHGAERRRAAARGRSPEKVFQRQGGGRGLHVLGNRHREGRERCLAARDGGRDARPRRRVQAAARPRSDAPCSSSTSRPAARSASAAPTSRMRATPTCAACGARSR